MEILTNQILIIDDNQDNLELLADLIQHALPGYTSLTAQSGVKGLELAASANPDVILLDVLMPGMNGFEVCQKLKSDPITSLIPVIFLTAKSDREARVRAIEVGAEAFLARPVDELELIAQIRAMQKIKNAAALLRDEKVELTNRVAAQTQTLQKTHTATLNLLEDLYAENEARKKNEETLRLSEAALQQAQRVAHLGSWIWHIQSNRLEWSDEMYHIFGIQKQHFSGDLNDVVTHAIHPDDRQKVDQSNRMVSQYGKAVPLEYRVVRPDGTMRVVWGEAGELILDEDGQPATLTGIVQDITERKQGEDALRVSEQRFRTLFEKAPVGIYISRNGSGLFGNQKDLQMFGLSGVEEIIGRPVTDFLGPQSIEASRERTRRRALGLPTPADFETVGLRKDGSQFPVQVTVDLVELSDGPANLAFITDITERKQAHSLQEAVYQIAAAAESTASLDELYPKIHHSIASVMSAENFYIALYDEAQNLLRFPYFKNPEDESFVGGVNPGRGATAYVLRTGKSLLGTRERHAELERQGEVILLGVPSAIWLGVPLIVGGKTIGAMVVQHYSDPQAYGERELHMLEFVSSQVAVAINRKQAEAARSESERRYRGLFEHSPVSLWEEDFSQVKRHIEELRQSGVTDFRVFFTDHPGLVIELVSEIKVLDVNAATLALMHAARKDQLIGNLKKAISVKPDMDFEDELVNVAQGLTDFTWEGDNYRLDGERFTVSLHWSAAPGYEDTLEKVLVSLMDITERKQAEDQIRQLNASLEQRVEARTRELRTAQDQLVRQEKLATLGQLAGGVAHELRNPLGVINSAVYYLKLVQPDVDEKIKKYHLMIEQEVNTASRIINDLLDFGRIVSPDRQVVAIPELLQRVLARFAVPASVRVQLKLPERLPQVFADPLQLEQVLGNLTTNACQAMKDCEDGGTLTISASSKKKQVAIAIQDIGTGITPAAMQRLFEPLFTTKLRGIGLGLAVCKKLVDANGGRITVSSEPGRGSTFTLYLPVKE